jgi:hypothetical protein
MGSVTTKATKYGEELSKTVENQSKSVGNSRIGGNSEEKRQNLLPEIIRDQLFSFLIDDCQLFKGSFSLLRKESQLHRNYSGICY